MKSLRIQSNIFLVALLAFPLLFGCSSKDDDDDNGNPMGPQIQPPNFVVTSTNVTLTGGTEGIQFFATTDKDISVIRVDIINPINTTNTFNAGGEVFLSAEVIAFQDANVGYVKASGQWKFRIIGNLEPSKESFDVTVNFNVGT